MPALAQPPRMSSDEKCRVVGPMRKPGYRKCGAAGWPGRGRYGDVGERRDERGSAQGAAFSASVVVTRVTTVTRRGGEPHGRTAALSQSPMPDGGAELRVGGSETGAHCTMNSHCAEAVEEERTERRKTIQIHSRHSRAHSRGGGGGEQRRGRRSGTPEGGGGGGHSTVR